MKFPDIFQRSLPYFSGLWPVLTEIAADVMYHTAFPNGSAHG